MVCGCMICLGGHTYVLHVQHLSSLLVLYCIFHSIYPVPICGPVLCVLCWILLVVVPAFCCGYGCISVVPGKWLQAICLAGHVNYMYMLLFLFPLLGLVLSPPSSYFMIT